MPVQNTLLILRKYLLSKCSRDNLFKILILDDLSVSIVFLCDKLRTASTKLAQSKVLIKLGEENLGTDVQKVCGKIAANLQL